ncbi:tetraketide alpha-pyrone reductase 2 [Spinacia oleracea]|uniref:Tetraketide alpha-pyrone reductase 2 n=1 Tax=Spinacia oleracea TaxID=3562 RepID=A0A9R0I2K2_SPIOL|nr:tetraketide alpha-pyrone reductase 2-like [Spinacia oleracea]
MPVYCVTGGTGLIAANLVKSLLQMGHTVVVTVRNPENVDKVGFLWEMKGAKEKLRIIKADLMEEGSFDEAIQGVDGVFHAAAPVLVRYDENVQENLIEPSINGTLNVLKSCIKATTVKRVVFTSSCSAIRYREDIEQVSPLNESHWSDADYCKKHNLWYAYAKTLAEQSAWQIAKESGLDLVVVNPSFVIGPLLGPQPTSTLLLLLGIIKGAIGEYPNQEIGFVHIDDVVAAHILAMEESKASGRLICSSAVAHWTQIVDMLKAKYQSYPYENKCGSQKVDDKPHSMDTTKIQQLGFPAFKPIPQMFDDCIKSFQEKGFL